MDVVGFGHLDGYVNALAYRGLRCAAGMFAGLGDAAFAADCRQAAGGIRAAYAGAFLNPTTGWLAGWRSRDGQLHDYGFLWVNGPAIAFGLLDPGAAQRALSLYGLEEPAARLADELAYGLAHGYFNGGLGTGTEFRTWDGLRTGYEGTLIGNFGPVYALAIQRGILRPADPEWWPAGGE